MATTGNPRPRDPRPGGRKPAGDRGAENVGIREARMRFHELIGELRTGERSVVVLTFHRIPVAEIRAVAR